MIDRSYLPFQAAREYQDPGMQKWMGFFLSEHTSSLHAAKYRVEFSTDLSLSLIHIWSPSCLLNNSIPIFIVLCYPIVKYSLI